MNLAKRLVVLGTTNNLASAIIWSGLPIFAYQVTGSAFYTGALFVTASVSRAIMTIFGGYWVDKYSKKTLMNIGLFLNTLFYLLLFISFITSFHYSILILMLMVQGMGSVINISQNIWFNSLFSSEELTKKISGKNTFIMTSKTIGFALGPLVFSLFGSYTILFIALLTMICYLISLKFPNNPVLNERRGSKFTEIFTTISYVIKHKIHRSFLLVELINGAINPVVISISVFVLEEQFKSSTGILSTFWLIGGVGAIAGNLILSKFNIKKLRLITLFLLTNIIITGGIFLMAVSPNQLLYIVGFTILTLGNPMIINLVRSENFSLSPDNMKGKINSVANLCNDIGTLFVFAFIWSMVFHLGYKITLVFLSCLSLARIIMLINALYLRKKNREELNSNLKNKVPL
jgi:MFS family permease